MNDDLFTEMRGSWVVVRSNMSGVWSGRFGGATEDGRSVLLHEAVRAWSWEGALSCSELAITGPGDGSTLAIGVHAVVVTGVDEMILQTNTARERFER